MNIEDEYGNSWRVSGGDPANQPVLQLKARRFTDVVLPQWTLVTGELVDPARLPPDVLPRVRLRECLRVLREG